LIPSGIVLTGGTSKMEGAVELAEEVFHVPVRLASPQGVSGLSDVVSNPIHSTGVGLLQYGLKQLESGKQVKSRPKQSGWQSFRKWISENF
jgi:cell division protein FtsA